MITSGFKLGFVSWRVDTIINNLILVTTMIVCTSLLLQKMTANGIQSRETFKQVGMVIEKNTGAQMESQKALVDRVTLVETRQEQINAGFSDNVGKLEKIKDSLEKIKIQR